MKSRAWLGMVVFSTLLLAVACQTGESPLAEGERDITVAAFDLTTAAGIGAALDACNDNGTGQGTAGSTRFGNAVRKHDSGDVEGGQSDALGLLDWEYERADLGKWLCTDGEFEEIMTAAVSYVGLNLEIAWDGGLCSGDQEGGCVVVANDACRGILTPNPGSKIYYVTFDDIPDDPFVAKAPIFNSYPQWADVKVFDVDGVENPLADLTGTPATVAIFVEGQVPVAEAGLRLGHLKNQGAANEFVEILPEDQFPAPLTCSETASSGVFDRIASVFQVGHLYGAGTKSGLLSSFSPVGPIDPHSDTKVGITPSSTTLNDLQSVILTATVSGVDGVDTNGNVYEATPITAGDEISFIIDGAVQDPVLIDGGGKASLTLTCGEEIGFGEHEIGVQYNATVTHAESSTSDGDSPTGVATVTCATSFNVINFDRDPDNRPLKNGEVVNNTYAPAVVFSQVGGDGATCASGNVFAVSDPNTGNFGSPPRVASVCAASSPIAGDVQGWVRAQFATPQSDVCIAVFPTAKGRNAPTGEIKAYYTNGGTASVQGQGKMVCVAKKKFQGTTYLIQSVEFSGSNGVAKFDNLRYR